VSGICEEQKGAFDLGPGRPDHFPVMGQGGITRGEAGIFGAVWGNGFSGCWAPARHGVGGGNREGSRGAAGGN